MKLVSIFWIVFIFLFLSMGCSEVNDNIVPPPTVGVHPEGFGDASSPNFHKFVFRESNWSFNLHECQQCHAADYTGGTTGQSCLGCHTEPTGPEACNTCHGVFANPEYIAPPVDLEDNSEVSARGVGAHFTHVYDTNSVSVNYGCFECHKETVGTDLFVHEHIAPPPAEMEFGEFAHSDSLGLEPTYDFTNLNCSNTYCHGGFKFGKSSSSNQWAYAEDYIVGNNFTPVWNSTTGKEAACGTCHGEIDENGDLITPQPKGHFGTFVITDCVNCHSSVVNSDGEIIDKLKHINKEINYP